jgi:cytochrome P450
MTTANSAGLPTFPSVIDGSLDRVEEAERLLEQGSVARVLMGDREVWVALGYRAVRQMLTDPRFSREAATRPGGAAITQFDADPRMLTGLEGARHNRVRRLMSAAFSPRMVERLTPRVQAIADELLDGFAPSGERTDFVAALAAPLPVLVICELLGVPVEGREQVLAWGKIIGATTAYPPEVMEKALADIFSYLSEVIELRRRVPDDALISALIQVNDAEDHLTASELTSNVRMLLMAGHETTVNQLGSALYGLYRHPEQLESLRAEPELWPQAVDELLRHAMLTPISLPRVTTEEVDLDGTLIPAGEAVFPIIGVANRDPEVFPDPHRFDINRENPAPHIALGHGPHYCLGAQLAKLELRIALSSMFQRFPTIHPAVDLAELPWKKGHAVRSLEEFPLTW